ncbi:hypothetical protein OBBRIDRAFT_836424 [Obba rivulosa]|uniref:Uncharacterized protein n=1 Tax=Obba rivulosa TaxID=1052685 RepID=A0A8E2AUK9_9APHY|nr:hypothetical protein OBBRIDRAFT_836424 [Obba rivulosa]
MRLTIFSLLVAGAGLVSQTGASPLRVVVVSGHADGSNPAGVVSTTTEVHQGRPPCGRMKSTLDRITALFPGWPPSGAHTPPLPSAGVVPDQLESGMAHILPVSKPGPFPIGPLFHVGAVSIEQLEEAQRAQAQAEGKAHEEHTMPQDENAPGPLRVIRVGHRGHHFGMGKHRRPFIHRLHFALAALGPWEGRAVAFVLGCGIGVLLRMLWVLAVVVARTVRPGSPSQDHDALFDADLDAEEYAVPPPHYTADVKIPIPTEKTEPAEN